MKDADLAPRLSKMGVKWRLRERGFKDLAVKITILGHNFHLKNQFVGRQSADFRGGAPGERTCFRFFKQSRATLDENPEIRKA